MLKSLDLRVCNRMTRWLAWGAALLVVMAVYLYLEIETATAQSTNDAVQKAEEALKAPPATATRTASSAPASEDGMTDMSLLDLYIAGGIFMIPITLLSLVALAFAVERMFALRRNKVLPPELVEGFGDMSSEGGFDPRKAYRLCQQYPSPAANVIRAMLLKVGRPHSEVEQAVSEASDREATKLYSNVRPIALTVTISPLLGLLGTVQGMILAFHRTAIAEVGVNKAQALAAGIYTALVTTFAGLTVAIPAACLVHYLEGRILGRFREIDELLFNLLPQVERYEGKLRVNRQQLTDAGNGSEAAAGTPTAAAAPH